MQGNENTISFLGVTGEDIQALWGGCLPGEMLIPSGTILITLADIILTKVGLGGTVDWC